MKGLGAALKTPIILRSDASYFDMRPMPEPSSHGQSSPVGTAKVTKGLGATEKTPILARTALLN